MSDAALEETEGFICPFCLVGFASAATLSGHFLRFHEEQGDSQEVSGPLIRVEEDCHITPSNTGHCFKSCMVSRPQPCQQCKEIIWQNGLMCQSCNQTVHEQCLTEVHNKCVGRPMLEESTQRSSSQGGGALVGGVLQSGAQNGPVPAPRASHSKVKVKHLVAKGRERYVDDGFDLDLTYITDKIIAMSFPASGLESTYRNDLKDVARLLESRHSNNYMVFNLSERSYDTSKFNNQVLDFGWPDHLAPSLERLSSVCKSMKSWLDSDPRHVAVVHCKGGKGRTGCVIAAFMHYTEVCSSAQDALDHFASKRFTGKQPEGVKQPSQRRYVVYFSDLLKGRALLDGPPLLLRHLIIHGVPDFDGRGGCRPFVKVYQDLTLVATSGLYVCGSGSERVKITFYEGVKLKGEILIKCFHKKQHSTMELIFRVQFHTCFVKDLEMVFAKDELDEAHRDKRFPDHAKLDLIFTPVKSEKDLADVPVSNIRHSLLDGHEGRLFSGPTEQLSRSDSYQDFREVDELFQTLRHQSPQGQRQPAEDLIDLSSPGTSPRSPGGPLAKDIQRIPGPADASLYTVVDHLVKNVSRRSPPLAAAGGATRPLPTPPSSLEEDMAMSEEIRQTFEEMSSHPGQRPPSYSYVDTNTSVAVSMHPQSEWGEVRKPSTAARRDLHTAPPTEPPDYFNVSAISDGQNFVASQPVNRQSIIEITRPSTSSRPSQPAAAGVNPRDYANVKQEGDQPQAPPPQEDYVNNPHELLTAHNGGTTTAQDNGQTDYMNSDVIDQTLDRRGEHQMGQAVGGQSVDDIYSLPPDERDYINSGELEFSEEMEQSDDTEGQDQTANQTRGAPVKRGLSSITHAIKSKLHIKERGPSTVQSQTISSGDKTQSLGGFALHVPLERIQQKGEDYFFIKDTWGASKEVTAVGPPTDDTPPLPPTKASPSVAKKPMPPLQAAQPKPVTQPKPHPSKVQPQAHSPPHPMSNVPLPPLPTANKLRSPVSQPKFASTDEASSSKQPSFRQPPRKPAPYRANKPAPPPSTPVVEELKKRQSLNRQSSAPIHGRTTNGKPSGRVVSRKDVEDRRSYWYKESLTRDEAIALIRQSPPGSFIVRDSSTVTGGYALTIRVSEDTVRSKLKLQSDIMITEDMCVKHFLVQPDAKGVRLQGWSEPPFDDLVEFIRQHCMERYCLPCVLALPNSDLGGGSSAPHQPQHTRHQSRHHQEQAATDLIYLGMVDVSGPGLPDTIASVADQLKSLTLTKANVVNFKASKDGLTVTDTVSGSFVKRFHPLNTISCCTVDPLDTRWDFEGLQYKGKLVTVSKAKCFGFVWKPNERSGYMCALFGELEPSQPVGAIVHFVNKLLANHKS